MTPEELAARHPRLFHVTLPGSVPGILARGLLSTSRLLDLFEVAGADRVALEERRRPARRTLAHARHGAVTLTDNLPLSEAALERCLEDGLSPSDWLRLLNARVFFWADEAGLARLAGARANRGQELCVLVLDTLGLVAAHAARVELSPINSGSTIRKPARRGHATFTRLAEATRARPPRLREVVVRDAVSPITPHLIEVRRIG